MLANDVLKGVDAQEEPMLASVIYRNVPCLSGVVPNQLEAAVLDGMIIYGVCDVFHKVRVEEVGLVRALHNQPERGI